jgi:hypothetical protein
MYQQLTKDNIICIIGNTWLSKQLLKENLTLYLLNYN